MSMNISRLAARAAAVATITAVAVIGTAATAGAHISTNPSEITRSGYSRVAFQVPNESETAGTIKVEMTLPQENPIIFFRAEPKAGWTTHVVTGKLDKPVKVNNTTITQAVRSVSWTAQPGNRIGPGEFGVFTILVTGLPDNTDQLVIPTAQSYDDNKVSNWNQPPGDNGEEPESPAPVIDLTGSPTAGHEAAEPDAEHSDEPGTTEAAAGQDDPARWLGGAGLAVGALALGLALGGLLRGRRPTRSTPTDT